MYYIQRIIKIIVLFVWLNDKSGKPKTTWLISEALVLKSQLTCLKRDNCNLMSKTIKETNNYFDYYRLILLTSKIKIVQKRLVKF